MSDAPERIWLQDDGDYEGARDAMMGTDTGVTWCDTRVNDSDTEYLRADLVPRWSDDMVAAKKHEGPALLAWDDGRTLHSRKNASGTISHLAELPDYWMPLPAPPKGET
jgi:hypothetical protein